MKKFLSLLMALAMTLSLAACGGSDNEPAPADTSTPAESEDATNAIPTGVEDGVLTIAMECAYAPLQLGPERRFQRRRAHQQRPRFLCQRL